MEEDAFREGVEGVDALEVGVTSVRDQAVDLLYVFRDQLKSFAELVMPLCFECVMLGFALCEVFLQVTQRFLLFIKLLLALPVLGKNLHVRVRLLQLGNEH